MKEVRIQGRWIIIEPNFLKMDFESLTNIISLMELVIARPSNYRMDANLKLPILHLELVFLNR
jgi:hypothetical protein